MPISNSLRDELVAVLRKHLNTDVRMFDMDTISGGSINDAYALNTSAGRFFLKTNAADRHPSYFEAETDGLERLRKTKTIRIPATIAHGEFQDTTWLLLEHIESGTKNPSFWHLYGTGLARIHRTTTGSFGLEKNNYIGTLVQVNTPDKEWSSFFIHYRLEPLVKKARDAKKIEAGMAFRFERLYGKLKDLFPKEAPALLHGDLWHGNFICDSDSKPVLIDPAVYYGHREMDIAMLHLFDVVDPEFISAYTSEYPLEKAWQERTQLCNLYPLMVHVNLFGGHYVQEVEAGLKRWV